MTHSGTLVATPTGTSVSITELSASTLYSFTVSAFDAAGNPSSPLSVTTPPPPDTTPPTVSITSPASGATISGTVNVTASAADNVGVTRVRLRVDGVNIGAQDTTDPYLISWNTTTAGNGSHTLTAVARDAAGNLTISAPVTVTVANETTPPSVPTGLVGTANSPVSLTSTDNVGVTGYRVDRGGTLVASPTSTSVSITGLSASTTYSTVSAVDAAGNASAPSSPVSVTTPAPPPVSQPLWTAGMEGGNMNEWDGQYNGTNGLNGNGVYTSGSYASDGSVSVASKEQARSGLWSAKMSIPGTGAVRLLRSQETANLTDFVATAWYYFPQKYTLGSGGWTSIMQWKSVTSSQNDPLWLLGFNNTGAGGAMRLNLSWWSPTLAGPHQGESGKKSWYSPIDIPVGKWFKVEVRHVKASDFSGVIQVWQDGVQIVNLSNIKTNYVNGEISWYVGNYAAGITPSPVVIYVDDVTISLGRMP